MFDSGDTSCNPGHPDIAASILTLGLHCLINLHVLDRWLLVLTTAAAAGAGID